MKRYYSSALFIVALFLSSSVAAQTLNLLTWKGYAPTVLVDKFQKETGITVNVTYTNNEEMIAKLRATRGAGFDLAQPSNDRIAAAQEEYKIYQPIALAKVKTDQIIDSMLDTVERDSAVDGRPHAVPFSWGTSGLVVNKQHTPEVRDYTALLDEKYTGRVSYRLKRPTLIALAFAMGEDPFAKYADVDAYQALMEKVGEALIAGKPIVKNYWTNGDALLQSMRSGEVHVAMAWDNGGWKLHAENPNIDFVAPKSGALGWIDTFAIPAKAENVEAAYKWINFMLNPENAAVFTNAEKILTASKGSVDRTEMDVRDNFERTLDQAAMDNIKWYPPVPAQIESIEGLILNKVKAAR